MNATVETCARVSADDRLKLAAQRALAVPGSMAAQAQLFANQVRQDGVLLAAMCRQYLENCQRDMRGDELTGDGQMILADKAIVDVPSLRQSNDGDVGQATFAGKALIGVPALPSRNDDGLGQVIGADKANWWVPAPSSPKDDGNGQIIVADKASKSMPTPVVDFSVPQTYANVSPIKAGPNTREFETMKRIAQERAVTIMDSLKIDGLAIGDWAIGDCAKASSVKLREGHILRAVASHYRNADPRVRVRELIKVGDLQKIVQSAAEASDAA